jgi:hypothetical protein
MTQLDYSKFKTDINLTQYAAYLGYEIDRKKSTRSSIAMRKDSDKVIISRRGNIWVYFSVHDDDDNGTIIDFVRRRTHKNMGEIARDLQNWVSGGVQMIDIQTHAHEVVQQEYDSVRIANIFKFARPVQKHRYLESRGLTYDLLSNRRFAGCIYADRYHNAVFPHYKGGQVCGLELKNRDKALFVRGSEKTLWRSRILKDDTTLVIGEAVIDALSYHALTKRQSTVYVATGGGLSPEQGNIICSFVSGFENLKQVIIIPDHDKGGEKFEKRIRDAIEVSSFEGMIETHKPEQEGYDWNDVYMNRLKKQ